MNYACYFCVRPSASLSPITLCPLCWIASTFPLVLLYAWIHFVWSPAHLFAPSCVSTCAAYIEDMMLLQYCDDISVCTLLCVVSLYTCNDTLIQPWTHCSITHFTLRTDPTLFTLLISAPLLTSTRVLLVCHHITYIINVLAGNNCNSNIKKTSASGQNSPHCPDLYMWRDSAAQPMREHPE